MLVTLVAVLLMARIIYFSSNQTQTQEDENATGTRTVYYPMLDRVSVCIKNFAKHRDVEVEPARVDHSDSVFYKCWGVGLEIS